MSSDRVPVKHRIGVTAIEATVLLKIHAGELTSGLKNLLGQHIQRFLKEIGVLHVDGERGQAVTTIGVAAAQTCRFVLYDPESRNRFGAVEEAETASAGQWLEDLHVIAATSASATARTSVPAVTPPPPSKVRADDMRAELLALVRSHLGGSNPDEIAELLTERVVAYAADAILANRSRREEISRLGDQIEETERRLADLQRRRAALQSDVSVNQGQQLIETLAGKLKARLDADRELQTLVNGATEP